MKESSNSHDENLQKADRVAYLIAGHIRGTLTEAESDELDDWIVESDENLALFEKLTDEDNIEAAMQQYRRTEEQKAEAWADVKRNIRKEERPSVFHRLWPYFAAASLVLFFLSLYFFLQKNKPIPIEKPIAGEIKPGGVKAGSDKAVLTLADGRTIILDSTGEGMVAREGSVSIQQAGNGGIVYNGSDSSLAYNLVSTPRGGQYQVTLADGTKVWLNAESSLRFPTGMMTASRTVELHGEAYFEVAKNAERPFLVNVSTPTGDGGSIQVLGTHFNVNGYADDGSVVTTLLEGSVSVTKNGVTKKLAPGQNAITRNNVEIAAADVPEAIAWQNGKFLFRDATIRSIGEQIKRWYNVEVEYGDNIPGLFNTEASRKAPLATLLDGLEGTGQVHFTLQGKKLLIKR